MEKPHTKNLLIRQEYTLSVVLLLNYEIEIYSVFFRCDGAQHVNCVLFDICQVYIHEVCMRRQVFSKNTSVELEATSTSVSIDSMERNELNMN